jgi:hypothetical protein
VVVAFVLITLFDAVGAARDDAYQEAESLVAVSWASDAFLAEMRDRVHELSSAYATTVAEQEWSICGPGRR